MDPEALTLLIEAPADEANIYKGLLESNGIRCVLQGEHHAAFMLNIIGPSTVVVPRVMVRQADLSQAQALLADSPLVNETSAAGGLPEGSVCPVHELKALARCTRCGTFLCEGCGPLGSPALCEDCLDPAGPRKPKTLRKAARVGFALFYLVPLGVGLVMLVAIGIRMLFAKLS